MSEQHSPEPWKATKVEWGYRDYVQIADSTGQPIIGTEEYEGDGCVWYLTEADARRICACVNLCAGVLTEDIERLLSPGFEHLFAHRARFKLKAMAAEALKFQQDFSEFVKRQAEKKPC